jgi:hypothetical protein
MVISFSYTCSSFIFRFQFVINKSLVVTKRFAMHPINASLL